ncbi:GNAT family N-acetyltransferase [Streptomyces scopuliridis]|uniref:GNAT family N-acetyltransferase n=1 Tax=Streptomyces scopuliridis TaxID=452529 RepID=A0ACD4ZGE1_9ACTN|nr:GNAT family N-acetyltransferase [Streptomyces scopuliridis]WSB32641.1 GNAT family N-acetyltransferase [Streptomyces scopuliridis]WSB96891.1 GNAT family N-acetyltransferase [Streptomyces scopuliridis]WSC09405.1 GNAT family N-acetyltransferase [Streptomyces scopuliridis]
MTVHVREMTVDDCEAVATVRVRGWRHAYAGLIPRAYLDAMSVEEDTARRRAHLAEGGGRVVNLVAEHAGRVGGWGCYGPGRDADAAAGSAELYALYVLPERLSTGTGRALLDELTARAAGAGYQDMRLWVLAGNERARRFYAKAGFAPDGAAEAFEVGGVSVPEVRYARRLSASVAAAPSLG